MTPAQPVRTGLNPFLSQAVTPAGSGDLFNFASTLATASPALMLAILIIALIRRWLILPRELDNCEARITELEKDVDEWKTMALKSLNVGERAVSAVEGRSGDR